MKIFIGLILILLIIDIIRSVIILKIIHTKFYKLHKNKIAEKEYIYGKGKPFNLVIFGDSSFDVRADSGIQFGPAFEFIKFLSEKYEVHVHSFAIAGAKSYEVASKQLPKMHGLKKVDLVIIYMGANDAVQFGNPSRIINSYNKVLDATEALKIPLVASEIANYYALDIFSLPHKLWIYIVISRANSGMRHIFTTKKYSILVSIKHMHRKIHRNRRKITYLQDGFHPNDMTNIIWGQTLLKSALNDPKTKDVFTDIMIR